MINEFQKTGVGCSAPVMIGFFYDLRRHLSAAFPRGNFERSGAKGRSSWCIVKEFASIAQIGNLALYDLRRTCARLCHVAGGELEQIQFLLSYVSVRTTEKYLGCKQRLRIAVNDHIGIEPDN